MPIDPTAPPTIVAPWKETATKKPRMVGLNELIGGPMPSMADVSTLNALLFKNDAAFIGSTGYNLIRTTDNTAGAVGMFGDELGKLRLRVFSPKAGVDPLSEEASLPENQSELGKWLDKGMKLSWGLSTMLKRWVWSYIEGILFWQQRYHYVDGYGLAPDYRWGERKKKGAGGHLYLAADMESVIEEERYSMAYGSEYKEAEILSPLDWIIFHPGSSANPDGDSELAIRFYRQAKLYQEGDKNGAIFAKSMTLPTVWLNWLADHMQIGQLATRNEEIADSIDLTKITEMFVIGNSQKTLADLLVYPTDGAKYLLDRETRLEGRSNKALLNTVLLSDTRATGPTGSSYQARETANSPVICAADVFATAITVYAFQHMIVRNEMTFPGSVPRLQEGDMPPRAQLVMPDNKADDTNPSKTTFPDQNPDDKPMQEGNSKKEDDADEVE